MCGVGFDHGSPSLGEKYGIFLIRRTNHCIADYAVGPGNRNATNDAVIEMAHSVRLDSSERTKLISLLPRLRRFATVLAGEQARADTLLRAACRRMLNGAGSYQQGTAFDIWAFKGLYGQWLAELREHESPLAQSQGESAAFIVDSLLQEDDQHLDETLKILAGLPAQQRSATLLIYGEGFSYEEAATILDTEAATVMARLTRALSTFIEQAGWLKSAVRPSAEVQQLKQINVQAS